MINGTCVAPALGLLGVSDVYPASISMLSHSTYSSILLELLQLTSWLSEQWSAWSLHSSHDNVIIIIVIPEEVEEEDTWCCSVLPYCHYCQSNRITRRVQLLFLYKTLLQTPAAPQSSSRAPTDHNHFTMKGLDPTGLY